VYDAPRARITFADKSHARFHFQRSIKPRYGMRGASFYFDLNDLRHAFSALNMPPPAKRVHISRLGTFRSVYMSHAGPQRLTGQARSRLGWRAAGVWRAHSRGCPRALQMVPDHHHHAQFGFRHLEHRHEVRHSAANCGHAIYVQRRS